MLSRWRRCALGSDDVLHRAAARGDIQPNAIVLGSGCGFLLRYKFIDEQTIRIERYLELTIWIYVLIRCGTLLCS